MPCRAVRSYQECHHRPSGPCWRIAYTPSSQNFVGNRRKTFSNAFIVSRLSAPATGSGSGGSITKSSDCSTPTGTVMTAVSAVTVPKSVVTVDAVGRPLHALDDVREPDVESLGEVGGEAVVAVREHDLVAVDRVVIETVRREVFDPRAVLLLGAVLEVLAHALRAFAHPSPGARAPPP